MLYSVVLGSRSVNEGKILGRFLHNCGELSHGTEMCAYVGKREEILIVFRIRKAVIFLNLVEELWTTLSGEWDEEFI